MPKYEEVDFDPEYIPLTCAGRRARFIWLGQLRQCQDVFIRLHLSHQEHQDQILLSMLEATFGKGAANWRLMLILEARFGALLAQQETRICDPLAHEEAKRSSLLAQEELGRRMGAALKDDPKEYERFARAQKIVARAEEQGVARRPQVLAFYFALWFYVQDKPLPSRPQVYEFLAANGVPVTDEFKRNASREIFASPLLRDCPCGKAGRPRIGSKKWTRKVLKRA
jgi:hypothetical protein